MGRDARFMLILVGLCAGSVMSSCTYGDAEQCFKDRAVLILGTSVSRHWLFELQSVLTRKRGQLKQDDIIEVNPKKGDGH